MYFCKINIIHFRTMKRCRIITFTILLAAMGGLLSCNSDVVPPDVMDEEKMSTFLQEAYLLEGFYGIETGFHYDSLHPEMIASYDSLLASYSISREDFERSVDWYVHHPEIYERVHDTILARIDRQLEE